MNTPDHDEIYDFVVIGSGFGGSVTAMRLVEKGYRVLVVEKGKRYADQDFAPSNWQVWKYLWMPWLWCFGILQISLFKDVLVLHGTGVGGGSLGYANVLMQPDERLFENPAWNILQDWKQALAPYYGIARRMLGVTVNPRLWPSDQILNEIAKESQVDHTFHACEVGVFFGNGAKEDEGKTYLDPFFNGEGPERNACRQCGGCMVGCRYNAKNTLVKNYLYLAEKWGAKIWPQSQVVRILPEGENQIDSYRLEIERVGSLIPRRKTIQARRVVLSAGTLGTLQLLFRCRDILKTLPGISPKLGDNVRTNSESLLGGLSKSKAVDYSQGIAITSIFQADGETAVEPVRYPAGSSLMRFLSAPMIPAHRSFWVNLSRIIAHFFLHPLDFLRCYVLPGWASRTTILLVMQTVDNRIRMKLGRSLFTLFRLGLVSDNQGMPIPAVSQTGERVTRRFSKTIEGIPAGAINESLLNTQMTAHILGGVPFGKNAEEGVVGKDCQVFNYPGLFVVDGSIVPANPGVNPSLTITALAEYAMAQIQAKDGHRVENPIGYD